MKRTKAIAGTLQSSTLIIVLLVLVISVPKNHWQTAFMWVCLVAGESSCACGWESDCVVGPEGVVAPLVGTRVLLHSWWA